MELSMNNLEKCFKEANEENMGYIGVKIQMSGFTKPEIIINPNGNFNQKLDYYKKAYNDDLTLKTFNGIKIVGFVCGNTFKDIEDNLMW